MRTGQGAPTPEDPRRRAEQLLAEARQQSQRGSEARAWVLSTEAAQVGRELGDAEIVGRAAVALRGPQLTSRTATAARQALCLEALGMLGPEPSDLRALVTAQLAAVTTAWSEPELPPAAIIPPEQAELRFVELQAAHARALGPTGVSQRLEIAANLAALGHAAADDEILSWGLLWQADALIQLGLRVEFARAVSAPTAVVARTDAPVWRWRLELIAANTALIEDRRDDASALAQGARELGRQAGARDADEIYLFFRDPLDERTGDDTDALERDVTVALTGAPHPMQAWRADLLARAGRTEEAVAIWKTIAPRLDALPEHAVEWLIASATFTRLAILTDDHASVTRLHDTLTPISHLHVSAGATTPYGGPVSHLLGMLTAHLGDPAAAADWHADAERRATAMGARWHAEQARSATSALTVSAASLSPRETEVATLIAQGEANRTIATQLFLSERTVEQHVRSILRKLGLPNRAAVAAWVASGGR